MNHRSRGNNTRLSAPANRRLGLQRTRPSTAASNEAASAAKDPAARIHARLPLHEYIQDRNRRPTTQLQGRSSQKPESQNARIVCRGDLRQMLRSAHTMAMDSLPRHQAFAFAQRFRTISFPTHAPWFISQRNSCEASGPALQTRGLDAPSARRTTLRLPDPEARVGTAEPPDSCIQFARGPVASAASLDAMRASRRRPRHEAIAGIVQPGARQLGTQPLQEHQWRVTCCGRESRRSQVTRTMGGRWSVDGGQEAPRAMPGGCRGGCEMAAASSRR